MLLYNLRLYLFPNKLKYRWYRTYTVVRVFPCFFIELKRDGEALFKMNGQRFKNYMGNNKEVKLVDDLSLFDV